MSELGTANDSEGVDGSGSGEYNASSEVGSFQRSLSTGPSSGPDNIGTMAETSQCAGNSGGPAKLASETSVNPPPLSITTPGNVPPEFFQQMVAVMMNMSERLMQQSTNKVRITDVYLPHFDPDGDVGVREWCDHVSTAKSKYNLEDYDVRMKVSSLLKGRAKIWADSWVVNTSTWEELRDNIIITFEPETRYSRDVIRFREHVYDPSKSISEFISQAWVLWRRVTKDKLDNSDAVEAVIGMFGDERLRMELMNVRAKSVPELISVASSIRPAKRINASQGNASLPQKRSKFSVENRNPFCNICKKNNHFTANCRFKTDSNSQSVDSKQAQPVPGVSLPPKNNFVKVCSYCSKPGHTFDTCYRRDKQVTSNINSISSSKGSNLNTMCIRVGDVEVNTVFDSGAECSVMRDSIASKLPGRRHQVVNYLRGLGPFPIISIYTLTVVCKINDINVEILFHILPDYEMTTDVLIGANLLHETGLSVIVTRTTATLLRQPYVMHIQSNHAMFDSLDHDLVNETEVSQLLALLNKYSFLFTKGFPRSRVNTGQLEIKLKNPDKFVERRPYRLSPVERQKVKDIVSELIENKIVRESKSPYSSPIILVKKKNGEDRMCVDYRELNSNTLRDQYPLPLISDQINQLAGGLYFTTLDMAAGFHQIPVASSSIEKTAFITPDGLYEYLTMPFGLCNAPSVYQRCVNKALGPLLNAGSANNDHNDSVAQVYIDDVITKCRDFSSGISFLERILIALRDSGFSINIDKCLFFKQSIEYLGNMVENGQVRPSPKKIEALQKAPTPTTVKQVRQFNGLAGYFRRFIPDFARTMIPLYNLTKPGVKWAWTHVHEEVRQKVIHYLTSSPVLTIFREGEPIELYTDASSLGLGAVLVQIINGRQHVVAYFSMRTTDIESRYHSYELETLAVVRAIKHFRHFLYGRKFKVITDCNAIKASKHKQDLLPRIHRWWAFLQNFDFEIEYRKGERMQHADFFSRNLTPMAVNIMTRNLEWLNIEQRRDSLLRPIIDAIHRGEEVSGYLLEDNVLKKERTDAVLGPRKLTVVPKSFQWSLINTFHTALKHPGWEKTLEKVRETYYFDKMTSLIRRFVDNCVVCRTSKQSSGATQIQLHPIPKPSVPFEVIHMDITGKLGNNSDQEYVIVTIDAFSKYVLLRYSNDKSQHSALGALKQVIHLFGTPKQIIVDGGREFLGEYKNYCDHFGIEIHSIAPGASRANGQVERVMGTLKNGLIMIKNYETLDWQTALDSLQLAFNCTTHRTTGVSPLTLVTRRQNCVPPELLNLVDIDSQSIDMEAVERHVSRRITEAASKDKARFDKGRANIHCFQRGEFVLIKNNPRNQTSLDLKFSAPYEIYRVLENDRYLVKKVIGHHGRPKKVAHDQLRRAPRPGSDVISQVAVSPSDEQQAGPSSAPVDDQQPGPSGITTTQTAAPARPRDEDSEMSD